MLMHSASIVRLLCVGLLTIRYPEMMLKPEVKKLYFEWLARDSDPAKKMQVNITSKCVDPNYCVCVCVSIYWCHRVVLYILLRLVL